VVLETANLDSAVQSISEAAKSGFKKVEKCSKNALRSVFEAHVQWTLERSDSDAIEAG
jgi:hypothetical protein